jgi:hypothetical protein
MEKKFKIGFLLNKITTDQFAIIESSYKDNEEVQFNYGLNFGFDKETRIIAIFFKFNLQQEGNPFLIIEVGGHFLIEPKTWNTFFNSDSEIITIPKNFMQHLAVITIGTSRGILHTKTENTIFNKFILPTVNVTEMIKEDVVFSLKSDEPVH